MSDAATEPTASPTTPRRRRRWPWIVAGLSLAAGLLFFALPYLFNVAPLRSAMLGVAAWTIDGTIHVEHASLGWWAPVDLRQVEVRDEQDEPLVEIEQIAGTQPLWRLLFDRRALGRFEFTRPQVRFFVDVDGSNFDRVFGPAETPDDEEPDAGPGPPKAPNVDLAVALVDATLTVRGPDSPREWTLERLNFAGGLQRSPQAGRGPIAIVEPGKLIDQVELTPEMCDDLLKYIAPVLSDATRTAGRFSIELTDEARIPLDAPEEGRLQGEFSIHSIDVAPGPLARELAQVLKFPSTIRLADESIVRFELIDGRMHHANLKFGLPRLWVETHGSVGLDQTLDLVAEVPLAGLAAEDAPLREALSQQTLRIPIGGTLAEPKIDVDAMKQGGMGLVGGAWEELFDDETVDVPALLSELREQGWFQEGILPGAPFFNRNRPPGEDVAEEEDADDSPDARPLLDLLEDGLLRRRRRSTDNPNQLAPPMEQLPPAPGDELDEQPEEERPLRRLFRRALDAVPPADVPTPPPPGETPP